MEIYGRSITNAGVQNISPSDRTLSHQIKDLITLASCSQAPSSLLSGVYTFVSSLSFAILNGALINPLLKKSIASCVSRRLPTYEPLMEIILTTVENTSAEILARAGSPTQTTVPRLRQYYSSTLSSEDSSGRWRRGAGNKQEGYYKKRTVPHTSVAC